MNAPEPQPKSEEDALALKIAQYLHAHEPTSESWGLVVKGAGAGWAEAEMKITAEHLNGHGVAHGGILFGFADTVFAWACNSRNQMSVGHQANITYLSPAQEGEVVTATAREEGTSGRSGAYTVRVVGGDGRIVAAFQGLSRSLGKPVLKPEEL